MRLTVTGQPVLARWLAGGSLIGSLWWSALSLAAGGSADEPLVAFVESDDAQCVVNDGKLVSLALQDPQQRVEAWVDRWFMQVQTADHTRHLLSAQHPEVILGCTRSSAGPQHWTLHHVVPLTDHD